MAERGDLGMKAKLNGLNFAQSEEVLLTGKAAPAESRLLSVEQILQVPQDLLHLLLGATSKTFSPHHHPPIYVWKGPKFDKSPSSSQDVLGLQGLMRIGQAALVLLLIILLSALPLLLIGIARR